VKLVSTTTDTWCIQARSLWSLILRTTDSLTVSEQWKIGTFC